MARIDGTKNTDRLEGTAGNDIINGFDGDDWISGNRGDDRIDGGGGNDRIVDYLGNNEIYGGEGNDQIVGGRDKDIIDGGSGDDMVWTGAGDDTGIHTLSENHNAKDYYDGGYGTDTFRLRLTQAELASAQADIEAYRNFLQANANPNTADGPVFQFKSFDLQLRNWEKLDVEVTPLPVLSIAPLDADKLEGTDGTTPFTFTVTRSGDTSVASTVDWAVTGAGANPAQSTDFAGNVFPSGKVEFAAGQTTSEPITVLVNADSQVEPDEGFKVTLANPLGASLDPAHTSAEGVIRNDDAPPPVLAVTATDADKLEGTDGTTPFTFTVTRSGDTSVASTVDWAVTGAGANPAQSTDFAGNVFPSGKVEFAAGQTTSEPIRVLVNADSQVEPDEGFKVTLANPIGASLDPAHTSAEGVIRNDDAPLPVLAVTATDANKLEGTDGTTPFTFTVTRSGDTSVASTVDWAVTGSGANPAQSTDFGAMCSPVAR